ncbi:hypothetical protein Syun_015764 [Stephania yunnanensis]|uniref:Uncharacterized protein n=1 Tax=Stephania yunnanensis TaxID=152371 RepID=A0AAP0PAV2_9MAGN
MDGCPRWSIEDDIIANEDRSETLEFAAESTEKGLDTMIKAADCAEAAEIRVELGLLWVKRITSGSILRCIKIV